MIDLTALVVKSTRIGINLSIMFERDGIRIYAERKFQNDKFRISKFVPMASIARHWDQKLLADQILDEIIEKMDYETEMAIIEGRI